MVAGTDPTRHLGAGGPIPSIEARTGIRNESSDSAEYRARIPTLRCFPFFDLLSYHQATETAGIARIARFCPRGRASAGERRLILYLAPTSLAKRYVAEPGSEEVDAATRTSAATAMVVIGQVEMAAALARGVRMDALSREDAHPADLTQLLDTWGD